MIIEDTLSVLLRDIPADKVLAHWLRHDKKIEPLCIDYNKKLCYTSLINRTNHYSSDEAEYAFRYAQNYSLGQLGGHSDFGVFGLVAYATQDILTTNAQNECICHYKSLLDFRRLSHPIGSTVFIAAHLAYKDVLQPFNRRVFSWSPIVRCDNYQLQTVLNKGMAENHYHIGGSTDAFLFQWICLMNHISGKQKEFREMKLEFQPLASHPSESSLFPLVVKAAFLRYFLYCKLLGIRAFDNNDGHDDEYHIRKYIDLPAEDCDQYTKELDNLAYSLREFCKCTETPNEFIADYALYGEPFPPLDDNSSPPTNTYAVRNYERRLYRPIAGEQKFQYHLFKSIYQKDPAIMPYLDLAYAYLLIYCRFRAELIQVNERVGFKNFLQYQDRKDCFTNKSKEYDSLRLSIAQQSVTSNPQILAFEGRLCPSDTSLKLRNKVADMLLHSAHTDFSSPYVRDYIKKPFENISESIKNLEHECQVLQAHNADIPSDLLLALRTLQNTDKKLSYTLHFPKEAQFISQDENFELTNPRDSKIRHRVAKQANAIIDARYKYPQIMSWVTSIDACSSEIDCRPEVFGPEFRHMQQPLLNTGEHFADIHQLPSLRITYHAGEDFLDPIDGIRAIDEAMQYLNMKNGDRFGHALALGIDCEKWYAFKGNSVILQQQAVLDNLVWLYGNMHKYNIHNTAAEDYVRKWFKKLFTDIYISNIDRQSSPNSILINLNIDDYFASLSLRGNDPYTYFHNPDGSIQDCKNFEKALQAADSEPWKLCHNAEALFDPVSNALYHYYHWNYEMKKASSKIIEYSVPRCIVEAISEVQRKMQYQVAQKGIGIECNPSSNYLIGTFRDYLKHPIFQFDNKDLYNPLDKRSQIPNPHITASINTDDLGIFDTSLENEYALMASALEVQNIFCDQEDVILPQQIYAWLDHIRQNGCDQNFKKT